MKPLIASLLVLTFATTAATAQMRLAATIESSESPTAAALPINHANSMTTQQVVAMERTAERASLAETISSVTSKMLAEHISGATETLRDGQSLDMSAMTRIEGSIVDQRSINVHVTYDPRPVGGILNIRVELVPLFAGIGSAVRPTISREFAQAVDDFDDDLISQTITQLSGELAKEYAQK